MYAYLELFRSYFFLRLFVTSACISALSLPQITFGRFRISHFRELPMSFLKLIHQKKAYKQWNT